MEAGLIEALESSLGASVIGSSPVSGGDTAVAHRVELRDGRTVFAKTHSAAPPGFFVTEAESLQWLVEADAVQVPGVLAVGDDPAFLVLEWIDKGAPGAGTEASFGRSLAALHRAGAPSFGRVDGRPTGSRQLPNDPVPTWAEFWSECRLSPLADMARESGALDPHSIDGLRRIAARLTDLGGPIGPPARLHGDPWAGNRLVDRNGTSWLVDPAAFGGHREFDLAMMRLFGGFGPESFHAYQEAFPLDDGWQDRVQLHQLAPLVVHAVKFGGGYREAAAAVITHYR